ncbi:LysR family transcriptional regulator [Granulosicoccus antarcticus]|uniref:HTH-type transcriptional regulator TsaR n=1 Tax=Granulosicoccus antarcticus IMCC3135 TaxID=1192854 RepID=A0A2Z2P0K4_9GAMM|nr:LysR family transcriptional regulator [Granulosicoccus antarcticus]ASJ75648.1 HTH-type transcriptional regulator TsaR [Granulosicoccus antarcticus IMCC3135]
MFANLQALRRLVAIADCGTVHAAAEMLSLTQPALSRSIRLLEEEWNVQLFERHPRGLRLTPFGERACQHARHLLRECQLAEDDLTALSGGGMGLIRLAGAPVWMSTILPQVIVDMHELYPDLQIQLSSMKFTVALEELDNGGLDIYCGGFQKTEKMPSFLVSQPLFGTRLNVVARKGHPILSRPLARLDPLLDYPWVSYMSDRAYLGMLMDKVQAATGQRKEAVVFCDSMLAALNLLNNGNYLAFLPSTFITLMPGFDLQIISTDIAEVGFDSGIIFRRSLERSLVLDAFQSSIRNRLAEGSFDPLLSTQAD